MGIAGPPSTEPKNYHYLSIVCTNVLHVFFFELYAFIILTSTLFLQKIKNDWYDTCMWYVVTIFGCHSDAKKILVLNTCKYFDLCYDTGLNSL